MAADFSIQGQGNAAPGCWSVVSAPAANTQPVATKAANPAARHIATNLVASLAAAAGVQPALYIVIRDGASGAGAIIWQALIGPIPSGQTNPELVFDIPNMVGTANTPMTAEFITTGGAAGAPALGNFGAITLLGWDG